MTLSRPIRRASRAKRLDRFASYVPDALLILCGLVVFAIHPAPMWVENSYANGAYPAMQRVITPFTNLLPFAVCDALLLGLIAGFAAWTVRLVRRPEAPAWWVTVGRIVLRALAVSALLYAWFYLAWGWNYSRPGVATRIDYDPARITKAAVHDLTTRTIRELNAGVGAAHASHDRGRDAIAMRTNMPAAYQDVVHSLGDRFDPIVTVPKFSLLNPWLAATGITGFIDPYGLETILNADLLWFERPFTLAHEWGHLGAFADESEANFIGVLTALHATDPAIRYSGWMAVYLYLPASELQHITLDKRVVADIIALRDRIVKKINMPAYQFSWKAYDGYLKSNHVAAGVESYTQLIQLMLGTRFAPDGLPKPRTPL